MGGTCVGTPLSNCARPFRTLLAAAGTQTQMISEDQIWRLATTKIPYLEKD